VSSGKQIVILGGGSSPFRIHPLGQKVVPLSALLLALFVPSTAFPLSGETTSCASIEREHTAWSSLLRKYVHDGLVDYEGLKRQGVAELDNYLATLSSVCAADERAASRGERLAFWINAYNAFTVKLILDHYPIRSIRSIGWVPQAAFKKKFIPMPGLGKGDLSLDEIENDILRKELGEPRIHFAIVCASKSCPKLRSQAYRADGVDLQLDQAARDFIQDSSKNRYDAAKRTFYASSIFKWFRGDFERAKGSLAAFIAQYAQPDVDAALKRGGVGIEFLDYDWSLNGN
jgi:hypothetical protein